MNGDITTRSAPSPCVRCGRTMDAHSGQGTPEEGDATVCLYCGAVMIYASAALDLREATPDEIAEIKRVMPLLLGEARRLSRLYQRTFLDRDN
jgi:DNA-directed RNA polymerase subunit RPC12/RpoP